MLILCGKRKKTLYKCVTRTQDNKLCYSEWIKRENLPYLRLKTAYQYRLVVQIGNSNTKEDQNTSASPPYWQWQHIVVESKVDATFMFLTGLNKPLHTPDRIS